MKTFAVGLWVLVVALGAVFAVATIGAPSRSNVAEAKAVLQLEKTRVINVPMIADGAVRGFIVAQFGFTVDAAKAKTLPISPEAFLLDEAFRLIYTDEKLDFLHLEKFDINGFTRRLVAATNKRLGVDLVHDVLIQDFTFISKEENDR